MSRHLHISTPHRHRHRSLAAATLLLALLVLAASCSTTKNLPEGDVLYTGVKEIAYDWTPAAVPGASSAGSPAVPGAFPPGDPVPDSVRSIVKANVSAALSRAPNNAIFGSNSVRWPLPIGLWIYNATVGSNSRFGRWVFDTFAKQPVTIASVNPAMRTQVAMQTLRANGFFRGHASATVLPSAKNPRKARVAYAVTPGPLFRIDTIERQPIVPVADSLIRATLPTTLIHSGDPFSADKLDAERKRIAKTLQSRGFYYFRPEHISFLADTIQRPGYVKLRMRPAPTMPPRARNQYRIGRTTITIFANNDFQVSDSTNNPTRTLQQQSGRRRAQRFSSRSDSLRRARSRDAFVMRWSGGDQAPLRMGAIRQYLIYQPGQLYHQRLHELMQGFLSGMGIFSNIQVNYTLRDTTDTCSVLDVNILGILDKPYESEFHAKVTNKTNGLLGPGIGWGMTKHNAFRGAENLNFNIYGTYEWQTGVQSSNADRGLLNSFELGTSLSLKYPRLMPRLLGRWAFMAQRRQAQRQGTPSFRSLATTTFKLDADWMNRASYFQMIRFSASMAYTYRRRPWFQHEITPLRLDYNMLVNSSERFDSIVASNQALYVSMRNQLVPSIAYTMTWTPRPRGGHTRSLILSFKEAGHIVNGIYALAGQGRKTRDKKLLGVPFAQFLKLTAEWRSSWAITDRSTIATRAMAGAVWSYGNSTMAPYADLFSVGGANSIRAFGVRTIGPGSYHPSASGWSYVDQVGNIKLEANAEWRVKIIGGLEAAVFLDAGNVWLMKPDAQRPGASIDASTFFREIALGTGLGIRYDLDFIVLRFDVGMGLHAPYDTGRSGYYNLPRFGDSLGYHIAVGYPF